jgi:hypothetical protein
MLELRELVNDYKRQTNYEMSMSNTGRCQSKFRRLKQMLGWIDGGGNKLFRLDVAWGCR